MFSEVTLNLISFSAMTLTAVAMFYMAWKVNVQPLRTFSVLLALFALTHGFYHLFESLETEPYEFVGDVIFEPIGWLFLLAFSIYFGKRGG